MTLKEFHYHMRHLRVCRIQKLAVSGPGGRAIVLAANLLVLHSYESDIPGFCSRDQLLLYGRV